MTTQNSGQDLGNNRLRRLGRISQSFSGRILLTMGSNVSISVMALATGSLVARLLGPQGRGELAVIQTWPAFIALLAALGLPDAVVYFSSQRPSQSGTYLASGMTFFLICALPAIIVGNLLMPLLLRAQSLEIVAATRWYLMLFIPLMATQGMLLHPLRGQNHFVVWNVLRIMNAVGWLGVVFVAWLLRIATPDTLAYGYLAMLAVLGVPTWLIVRRYVRGPYVVNRHLWRPMLNFGLPSAISAIPQVVNLRLDQLMMAAFLAPDRLGYYVVAVAWSSALLPVLNSVGAVLFPRVAMEGELGGQVEALGRVARLGASLSLLLGTLLFLVTPLAIRWLFGSAFEPATASALILVIAGIVLSINGIFEEGLRGLGKTRAILWSESVGVVVTVVGLLILLPSLEIAGAAIASLLGYSATGLALTLQLQRISGKSVGFFLWPQSADWRQAERQLKTMIGLWLSETS